MRKLSEFLARQLIDRGDYFGTTAEQEYGTEIKLMTIDFQIYIEAYKEHLRTDRPKTVQWAMIEKRLITALERMESNNNINYKYKCQCGHLFNKSCIVDFYGSSISPRCPECKSENFIEY